MAELPVLTAEELEAEWSQPLPIERLELVGVKLEDNYQLPRIEVAGFHNREGAEIAIIIRPSGRTIQFEENIPWGYVPDAMISLQTMVGLKFGSVDAIEIAVSVLIKRVARLRIERDDSEENDVHITLSCGSSDVALICTISELAGFISQPPETEERAARRDREIASFGWGRDSRI